MKKYLPLTLLLTLSWISTNALANDYAACMAAAEQHTKDLHTLPACQRAAAGHPDISYALGMSYGYAGDGARELQFYRAAADQGFVPAYLAIGHVMRAEPHKDRRAAIRWYRRYVESGGKASGYAARLISDLYAELGDEAQAGKWQAVCKASNYKDCE